MSVSTSLFSDEHYGRLIADHGYAFVDGVRPLDFPFPHLSTTLLRTRWLCHFRADTFAQLAVEGRRCIVTSGVGLSGPPHAGTVCQILRMSALRRAGLPVQFVLGDLDAYNARARSLEEVHGLADQYRMFLQRLGFEGENVTVRTQEQHLQVLRTAYLIARHVSDEAMAATEEDLAALYKAKGVYQGVTFPVKQAILLMAADFVSLCSDYDGVLVMLGVDEHRYVRLAADIEWDYLATSRIAGLYTRMIPGLRGYPKMSKSIPGSAIHVCTPRTEIVDAMVDDRESNDAPQRSASFQILCCLPDASDEEIAEALWAIRNDSSRWMRLRREVGVRFADICGLWPTRM